MTGFELAQFAADMVDRRIPPVIDKKFPATHLIHRRTQLRPLLIPQIPDAQCLKWDRSFGGEESEHQLFCRHLEREKCYPLVAFDCFKCHIEHKRGFAHRRACRDDDKIPFTETARTIVEIAEPGIDSNEFGVTHRFKAVDLLHHGYGHFVRLSKIFRGALLSNLIEFTLDKVHHLIGFEIIFDGDFFDLGCQGYQCPLVGMCFDLFDIGFGVGDGVG